MGASRSLTLVPCFPLFGELDVLILSKSDAMDSSSGVHVGEGCEETGGFRTDRLAKGSSRRSVGGTCGLATGPMTTDAGGVGSWMGLSDGVCDSGRPDSATDLGSQDEMEGRRVLEEVAVPAVAGMGGRIDCKEVRRFTGLSTTTSTDEWES